MTVTVANLMRVFQGLPEGIAIIEGASSEEACRRVRETFMQKAPDLEDWSRQIRDHCRIPPEHPFRELLKKRGVKESDHLWTLGALAFGTQNPWIVLQEIRWDDNTRSYPEADEQRWLGQSVARTAAR